MWKKINFPIKKSDHSSLLPFEMMIATSITATYTSSAYVKFYNTMYLSWIANCAKYMTNASTNKRRFSSVPSIIVLKLNTEAK